MEYCGLGLIVGKPEVQPEIATCCSSVVQRKFRNWSALSSKRTLSCIPRSAYGPSTPRARCTPGAGVAGAAASGAVSGGGGRGPRGNADGSVASTRACHCATATAGGARRPNRPPGTTAELGGTALQNGGA